jgi:hypothetical protein
MHPKAAFLLTALFLGHASFSQAADINPKKLQLPADPTSFSLDAAYTYSLKFKGVPVTYTVPSGTYVVELVGEGGLFLRCSAQCVEIITYAPRRPPIIEHAEGGLFLADQGAKIYLYRDYKGQSDFGGGPIVNAIIRAGDGKILFARKQPFDKSLKDQIRPASVTP